MGFGVIEMTAARSWNRLDPGLRHLAVQCAAGAIGCSWCIDFGYYEGIQRGLWTRGRCVTSPAGARAMPDERERAVLEYAEAASSTPADIPAPLAGPQESVVR